MFLMLLDGKKHSFLTFRQQGYFHDRAGGVEEIGKRRMVRTHTNGTPISWISVPKSLEVKLLSGTSVADDD